MRADERPGRRYAVVAGGGTAGHTQPALAVAEALVALGCDRSDVELVGSLRSRDAEQLGGKGFPLTLLPGRGITRKLGGRELGRNVVALVGLARALVGGVVLIARRRPAVVVSVGGYASLAPSLAAVALRVPLVIVNVDAVPGAANRMLGGFARASAVGWPGTPLPRAEVTGTPVRPEVLAVDRSPAGREAARRELGLPEERKVVVVFGGSLGARRINEAALGLARRWADRSDLAVHHVVGHRDWEAVHAAAPDLPAGGLLYRQVPYEHRMPLLYAASDVAVCRAGALTVAELAVVGLPSVLVPLPGAPGDHQTANARILASAGGARLLPDAECDEAHLAALLDRMLEHPADLAAVSSSARSLGHTDAAARVAALVTASARRSIGSRGPSAALRGSDGGRP